MISCSVKHFMAAFNVSSDGETRTSDPIYFIDQL